MPTKNFGETYVNVDLADRVIGFWREDAACGFREASANVADQVFQIQILHRQPSGFSDPNARRSEQSEERAVLPFGQLDDLVHFLFGVIALAQPLRFSEADSVPGNPLLFPDHPLHHANDVLDRCVAEFVGLNEITVLLPQFESGPFQVSFQSMRIWRGVSSGART